MVTGTVSGSASTGRPVAVVDVFFPTIECVAFSLEALSDVIFSLAALGGIALPDLTRPLQVTVAWVVLALFVGTVAVLAKPSSVRALRGDVIDRPDVSFAVGFLAFFGLLVGSALPFFVGVVLDEPAIATAGLLVGLPGILAWGAFVLVGGTLGLVGVGHWLASRVADPTPWQSLVVGTLALGPTQLVPLVGTFASLCLVTVGGGALVARWREARRTDSWFAAEDLFSTGSEPTAPVSDPEGSADGIAPTIGGGSPRNPSSGERGLGSAYRGGDAGELQSEDREGR